jgi:sugar/nucleoside kinase (ribokinase family)
MKKILGIGNALVDVMTMIDDDRILGEFSLPKGSMTLVDSKKSALVKQKTTNLKKSFTSGGSAANTIHGLGMLGVDSGFIGSVGKDETGDLFENDMKRAGVQNILIRRESVTGTAVALISPDTQRTFATHLGAAIELEADDLKEEFFKPYDILYFEGYLIINKPLVLEACKLAKQNNMEIAVDLASYNVVEANKDNFIEIIKEYVDIVFANEDEARMLTGLESDKALQEIGSMCRVAVVKTGAVGSLVRRGEEIVKVGTLPIDCVDTTGAGDLYASGFLYGYANDMELDKCGAIGALLAGNVIEQVGARIPDGKWPEIKNLISEISNPANQI